MEACINKRSPKMVKRTYDLPNEEPDQKQFDIPSEKEHLLQCTDIFTIEDEMGVKLGLDENTVAVKLEVVGGEESGRTLLQRLSLDQSWKGFFATRLFLKAIGADYKGAISIDTDMWVGEQVFATVIHAKSKDGSKTYANIKEYNFDKRIEKAKLKTTDPNDIQWDDEPKK